MPPFKVYNLSKVGVNVDSDDMHVPVGAFRQTQNLHRDPLGKAESVVNRQGLETFNINNLAGTVLGGVPIPTFNLSTGNLTFFMGFGEAL